MKNKKRIILLVITVLILVPLVIPVFTPYVLGTADGLAHKFRLVSFEHSLKEGYLRPRWLGDQALGFGSPIFIFNYLLPYYSIAALNAFGLTVNLSTQVFIAATILLSFVFMFLLGRKLWGTNTGLVAGGVYAWAPYHLLTVFLYEGWGEFAAFVFPPLLLFLILKIRDLGEKSDIYPSYSGLQILNAAKLIRRVYTDSNLSLRSIKAERIRNKPEKAKKLFIIYLVLTVFSWFLFILTHNVSALLFSPLLLLLSFVTADFRLSKKFLLTVYAFISTVFLSAFFWLPAVSMDNLTAYPQLMAKEMEIRGSYFKSFYTLLSVAFSTIRSGSVGYYDFTVGLPIIIVFVAGLMFIIRYLVKLFKTSKFQMPKIANELVKAVTGREKLVIWLFIILFGSLYLSNHASNLLWDIPFFRLIVYPFRFLFPATFAGSLLAGWIGRKNNLIAFTFILLAIVAGRPYTNPAIDKFPFADSYFQKVQTVFHPPGTLKNMATREFLPQGADLSFLQNTQDEYLASGKLPSKFVFTEGSGKVLTEDLSAEKMQATVVSLGQSQLTVNTFYFPDWRAYIDRKQAVLDRDQYGRMRVWLPAGRHDVLFVFGVSNIEKAGDIISILGAIFLAGSVYYISKLRRIN